MGKNVPTSSEVSESSGTSTPVRASEDTNDDAGTLSKKDRKKKRKNEAGESSCKNMPETGREDPEDSAKKNKEKKRKIEATAEEPSDAIDDKGEHVTGSEDWNDS